MSLHSAEICVIPGSVFYWPSVLDRGEADRFFRVLLDETDWLQHTVKLFGNSVKCPRLSAWHGDDDAIYSYSGMRLRPEPWTPALMELKHRIETAAAWSFNSVLLNLYRSGSDSMGWHADDEPVLGEQPTIASVSLGAMRRFRLKKRTSGSGPEPDREALDLGHGSLLVMRGRCQAEWMHSLPKTVRPVGQRINLTFRRIIPRPNGPK